MFATNAYALPHPQRSPQNALSSQKQLLSRILCGAQQENVVFSATFPFALLPMPRRHEKDQQGLTSVQREKTTWGFFEFSILNSQFRNDYFRTRPYLVGARAFSSSNQLTTMWIRGVVGVPGWL